MDVCIVACGFLLDSALHLGKNLCLMQTVVGITLTSAHLTQSLAKSISALV